MPLRQALLALALASAVQAQTSHYVLRVDAADTTGYQVEFRVRNAPARFALAMAAHPEYDDKFWRQVEDLRVTVNGQDVGVTKEEDALWRVASAAGDAVVRYRIHLPPQTRPRGAWRPFLAPTGGLVGGPHSFMYLLGREGSASTVELALPKGWIFATALMEAKDRTLSAPDVNTLLESPILVGALRHWSFQVAGATHRVFYWPRRDAAAFDTVAFVRNVQGITKQAIAVFGGAPRREYTFLYQDDAFGALEHANSVTIGVPSAELARDPAASAPETAHEFFHSWNLMRIKPFGYGVVSHRPAVLSTGLWFSEGLSLFYSDLMRRRAGMALPDSTRALHVASAIARYLSSPGNGQLSAERVSQASYAPEPGMLGDLDGSTHLQGELIGMVFDFMIRAGSGGKRSVDDLMRAMFSHFGTGPGFTAADVEHQVATLCACDTRTFFDAHVRGGSPIDFDRYARLIGLTVDVTWGPALDRANKPVPDTRVRAWRPEGTRETRLLIWHPTSTWTRAGLHTGDLLESANGTLAADVNGFRTWISSLAIGDTARIVVRRGQRSVSVVVPIAGFDRPFVTVRALPKATASQRSLGERWLAGTP